MTDGIDEISEKLRDSTERMLDQNARNIEEQKHRLTSGEKRYLEYFWNPKTKTFRESIPLRVISFLEAESWHSSMNDLVDVRVDSDLFSLEIKGYIAPFRKDDERKYSLTPLGVGYMKDAHPKLIVLWERIFDRTPKLLSLTVTILGLVASVFGIIQFFHDLHLRKP
jgi:hypothetical protein